MVDPKVLSLLARLGPSERTSVLFQTVDPRRAEWREHVMAIPDVDERARLLSTRSRDLLAPVLSRFAGVPEVEARFSEGASHFVVLGPASALRDLLALGGWVDRAEQVRAVPEERAVAFA